VPELARGVAGDDVLLVDVGGGVGHDLAEFRRKWPGVKGRLVLQDLGEVIEQAKAMNRETERGVEATVHDFFTEQPVKGMVHLPPQQTPELTNNLQQAHEHTTCTRSCMTGQTPTAAGSYQTWSPP
jgi:hypothetical protein